VGRFKISTFSVIVGSLACDAQCPYCVSKTTPTCGAEKLVSLNLRNFRIACDLAKKSGVTTMLLTGKGEPTLHPVHIKEYIDEGRFYFPLIELQTNGILMTTNESLRTNLRCWYDFGLTTVCISIAHYDPKRNAEIFRPHNPYDIWPVVDKLHEIGLSVRISCVLVKGYVDSFVEVSALVDICRLKKVEQLIIREVAAPDNSKNAEVAQYVAEHRTTGLCDFIRDRRFAYDTSVTKLLELPHGGTVYDWNGQNICLGNCLTGSTNPDDIRQLIFFPDGHLRHDWRYPGAIIL